MDGTERDGEKRKQRETRRLAGKPKESSKLGIRR